MRLYKEEFDTFINVTGCRKTQNIIKMYQNITRLYICVNWFKDIPFRGVHTGTRISCCKLINVKSRPFVPDANHSGFPLK